jgi:HlyD family secretion protein
MRGILVLAALVAFGVPAVLTVAQQRPGGQAVASEPDIYIVQPRSVEDRANADGDIEPDSTVILSFERSGQITDVYLSAGDYVSEGEIIAQLENERERIDVEQARVTLQMAELDLEDILLVDDDEIRRAEARVQAAKDTYGFTANQVTEQDIRAAEMRFNDAQRTIDAAYEAKIVGGGTMFEEGVTLLEAQIGEATFNAEVARLELEYLRTVNQPQLGAAAERIAEAEANLLAVLAGPTDFEIESAELAVQSRENDLAEAELAYERTLLRAPREGILTDVSIEEGQRIVVGNEVMKLVDTNPLHVLAEVDEIDYRQIAIGMEAVVTLDALPGVRLPGVVTRIAPEGVEVAGVVVYETEIELQVNDPRIRPGMSATAFFGVNQEAAEVLVVPKRFFLEDGRTVQVVQSDGTLEAVQVQTGAETPGGIEVTSGLSAGDALVVINEPLQQ